MRGGSVRWGGATLVVFALFTVGAAGTVSAAGSPVDENRAAFLKYRARLDAVLAAEGAAGRQVTGQGGATGATAGGSTAASPCHLYQPGAAAAPATECVACHRGTSGTSHTHPVDVDYESLRSGSRVTALRPAADVVARGVLLPDGQIRCGTCHDGHSPWMYRIALPPTAEVRPAANLADHASYEADRRPPSAPPPLRAGQTTAPVAPQLKPGSMVSPTPLCKACHAFD